MPACGRCGLPFSQFSPPPTYPRPDSVPPMRLPVWLPLALCLIVILGVIFAYTFSVMRLQSSRLAAGGDGLFGAPGPSSGAANLVSGPVIDSRQIDQRLLRATANTGGEIEVSLAWNSLTDLDLEVRDPTGEVTWAYNPRSRSGGVQDVDSNPTLLTSEGSSRAHSGQVPGAETILPIPEFLIDLDERLGGRGGLPLLGVMPGSEGKAPSRFTRRPIEHIYFAKAPRGTYTVLAGCYCWRESDRNPLPFTIQVRSRGKALREMNGAIGPQCYAVDGARPIPVLQFSYP